MQHPSSSEAIDERFSALIEPVAMRLALAILLLATAVPSLFLG